MSRLAVPVQAREKLLSALVLRDFVGLAQELESSGITGEAAELLIEVPQRRGGPEILSDTPAPAEEAVTGLRLVHELLEPRVAERVIFDLGLIRNIGYYTGAVFDVYDPGPRRAYRRRGALRRSAGAFRAATSRPSASRWA